MIDRSNAVNLARNLREYLVTPTLEGVRCLVDAVLAMDEYIRSSEADQRDAALEEAAKLFDGYTYGVYAHPAKIIRALKRQSATSPTIDRNACCQ